MVLSNLATRMVKQFLFSIFILFSVISFSQKKSWERFVIERTSEDFKPSTFVIAEMDAQEVQEMYRRGIAPIRRIDADHFIFRQQDLYLEDTKTWNVTNDWKMNIREVEIGNDLFIIKSTSALSFDHLQNIEVVYHNGSSNVYLIRSNETVLNSLKNNSKVIYISNESVVPKVESRVIDMNINPNRVNKVHHLFPLIDGSTETVSIQEERFNVTDIDLIDRYVESDLGSTVFDNHADEMATIIAGAGNSFVTGRGVAKNANIASSNFFPVFPDADEAYLSLGINTQNHSYGTLIELFYGAQAEAFDQSAFNNKNLLHVFSVGNQGLVVKTDGLYANIEGYANITGNYKMSKNTLSVGSVDTVGRAISFVSRGPAYDGRVKPELVAYSSVGSSNSAALVSGISVLLQQQYREIFAEDMPSSLAKALLINSADDVGSVGLDFVTGYGSVNAHRSLQTLRDNHIYSGAVSQGEIDQIALSLPANAVNLKLTLVWADLPANPMDATALVNDLDVRLVDGSLSTTLPWVLDHTPNKASLSAPATRNIDRLNNVEQITIDSPENMYTIEVEGFSTIGVQDYYIAYQYELADFFEWDYPTGSDNMPYDGESGSYFRWNTTMTGTGQLAYSIDEGVNWEILADDIDLSNGYWRWNSVPDVSTEAIAKMTIGADEFTSESFTISRPFKSKVGFNCADSVMLRWPKTPNAMSYTVRSLGVRLLEEVATVSDTFLIISSKSAFDDKRFSIQPNLENGSSLIRSPTFDYSLQGVDCYVVSFFQEVALDTGIYLNLQLGTTYGIDELQFFRKEGLDDIKVGEVKNSNTDVVRILDVKPNQGFNEHFVVVKFSNGEEIRLSSGIASYLTDIPIIVFPNPVFNTEELNVLFRDFESENPIFKVYDIKGSSVLIEREISTQESIPIKNLLPGIYIYSLEDGSSTYSGRLIVK